MGFDQTQLIQFLTSPYILILIIWEGIWKGIALWKSARHNQLVWFIAIIIVNSVGILPILYILFFQKNKKEEKK